MWFGVTAGFAITKFSSSPNAKGYLKQRYMKRNKTKVTPKISLIEKKGWKIKVFKDLTPRLLEDPVTCKYEIWTTTKAEIKKGNIKWKVKKRTIVGSSTEGPPQIVFTTCGPIYGISENKFVITEAPQKDIWLTGNT